MTSRSVTVLTVHGRRLNVKVEPDMTILEILETVCRKYTFRHEEYDLTHHNRVLDLSTMFRFAGLPNNALLEMAKVKRVRTEDDVIILLQLEDGARPSGTFQPAHSLLHVLQTLCPERPPGDAHTLMVYMRREVYWDALGMTTLKSLGLTKGRAILRLVQRKPELAKTQAHVSAPLPQTSREQTSERDSGDSRSSSSNVPSSEDNPIPGEANDKEQQAMAERHDGTETESQPQSQPDADLSTAGACSSVESSKKPKTDTTAPATAVPEEGPRRPSAQIVIVGERQAVLYHASGAEREVTEVADSFFELTVPEVLQMYKHLQDRVKALEEAPLVTGSLRELERNRNQLSTMARYRQAVIRVQFPDRHIIQAFFQVFETVAHVEEFVRSFLADPDASFHLYTTPPKVVLTPDVSLPYAGCFPQALIHFGCDQPHPHSSASSPEETFADAADAVASAPGCCVLRPELLSQLSNAAGAAAVAARAKRAAESDRSGPVAGCDETGTDGVADPPATHDGLPVTGPSNRIPNRNFRESASGSQTATNAREAKILKFLKK